MGQQGNSLYAIKDDILYKLEGRGRPSWKTYIPTGLEEDLILNFHTGLGNSGIERVIFAIREHLYIKRLANKVRKLISQYTLCQRAKPINARYDVEPQSILRDKPRALVAVVAMAPYQLQVLETNTSSCCTMCSQNS